MSYITTYRGIHFEPICPEENQLKIEDIAHSLSLICRANGHFTHFYSVASHCIACAREAAFRNLSARIQMACLLHDASEAYLSDVTRPIKHEMKRYLEVEEVLQEMIYGHFLGKVPTDEEREYIREIDDDMLSYEFHALMPEDLLGDRYKKIGCEMNMEFRMMDEVEKEFLVLFTKLAELI